MDSKLLKKIPAEQFARLRVQAAHAFAQRRGLGETTANGHLVFDLLAPEIGPFHLAWKVADDGQVVLVGAGFGSANNCRTCGEEDGDGFQGVQ